MDSYRPGQQSEDDSGKASGSEGPRNVPRSRDYDRPYERARDHRRRGPRDDMHYQNYPSGYSYRDFDRGNRYGERRFDSNRRMEYDEESDDRGDRYDTQGRASSFNTSDAMRYGEQYAGPANTGEKDKGSDKDESRYLLILDLKSSVTEELLAKGLEKLYRGADNDDKKIGATPLSLRSVMIVKARGTDKSMGYGFAEYHTAMDAKAARAKSQLDHHQCTISSKPFKAQIPHSGVFPPTSIRGKFGPTDEEFTFHNVFTGRQHKYYDERYYTKPHIVNEFSSTVRPDLQPDSTDIANEVKTGSKRGIDTAESQQSKPKKVKKTLDSQPLAELQKWQSKQAELREEIPDTISEPQTSDEQTYAVDTNEHKRCYLCNTKFETSEKLLQHLKKSETHAAFLQNDAKKAKALERLEKNSANLTATVKLPAQQTASAATPQQPLRDRAAERRQAEGPAKVKMSLKGATTSQKSSRPDSSGSDSAAPVASLDKGRGMLAKFGWSEGQGLGGDGSGHTAPVAQSVYAAGVGLGHEGSKRGDAVEEAGRRTRDERGNFLEQTRELARKRFEEM